MLPCRSTCTCAFEGCHKTCPRWRAMQEQQHAETARKKEYLRQADETCRAVLSQCRRCGHGEEHLLKRGPAMKH